MHGGLAISNYNTRPTMYLGEPIEAEILDCQPLWHLLVVQPAHENIAAGHLSARRFGVYKPEFEKRYVGTRGRASWTGRCALFPGYLFIYVWDILAHKRRILACPGVTRLMYDGLSPATVSLGVMGEIHRLEILQSNVGQKRPRKRFRRGVMDSAYGDEVVSVSSHSYPRTFAGEDITALDAEGRNGLLRKALGLI